MYRTWGWKKKVLQGSMTYLLKSFSEYKEDEFSVLDCLAKPWKCFPTLVSYYWNISEAKGVSVFLHSLSFPDHGSVDFQLLRIFNIFGTVGLDCSELTKAVRIYTREKFNEAKNKIEKVDKSQQQILMERGNQMVKKVLLSSWKSFL